MPTWVSIASLKNKSLCSLCLERSLEPIFLHSTFLCYLCACLGSAPLDTKTLCSLVTLSYLISQDCSSVNSKAPDYREGLKFLFWPLPKVLNVNWELALSISSCTFSFVSEFSDSPLLVFWTIGSSWLFFGPSWSFAIPLPPLVSEMMDSIQKPSFRSLKSVT